ncbi:hypothetical protein DZA65_03223 [Dickeya dianthicola]|uniref:hypothetical protein n=1 Tax=Dickeya dianthicola TaxID=204039 RepID=UPI000CD3DCC1|nr:hypothetical protein [Dickeya dianthicola]AYC20098.1 hypothetical protein DZA65_03223 [Dickeya dianthicola]MBI0438413.1 hypothetical protein [Dickeya dianthicola]MBI0450910.1 hypothetical protein [Dickeya dianthicola]MBI0454314.1 hypothetical protein [Dickeya dianthicola]MBI0458531.1 hypothetical protein [Dickeya dianthicola]
MKETGLIFNSDMVRAIIDGRKTQTRRIVKGCEGAAAFSPEWDIKNNEFFAVLGEKDHTGMNPVLGAISCPFGAVGDRIWVRETWQAIYDHTDEHGYVEERCYAKGIPKQKHYWKPVFAEAWGNEDHESRGFPWRPSIHMPRWASRITLEITGVRVERLNDISEDDARAEGIADGGCLTCGEPHPDATDAFAHLWQSIYGEENWFANPWVWVVEFRRIDGGVA